MAKLPSWVCGQCGEGHDARPIYCRCGARCDTAGLVKLDAQVDANGVGFRMTVVSAPTPGPVPGVDWVEKRDEFGGYFAQALTPAGSMLQVADHPANVPDRRWLAMVMAANGRVLGFDFAVDEPTARTAAITIAAAHEPQLAQR